MAMAVLPIPLGPLTNRHLVTQRWPITSEETSPRIGLSLMRNPDKSKSEPVS